MVEPVVLRFVGEYPNGKMRDVYEMVRTRQDACADMHCGFPLDGFSLEDAVDVSLTEARELFGTDRYQEAYDALKRDGVSVCFMGPVLKDRL